MASEGGTFVPLRVAHLKLLCLAHLFPLREAHLKLLCLAHLFPLRVAHLKLLCLVHLFPLRVVHLKPLCLVHFIPLQVVHLKPFWVVQLNRCHHILLDLDEAHGKSLTYEQCVKFNASSMMNVYKVAHTFATQGLDAVLTIRRSCKSDVSNLKVDGRAEAQLIQLACSKAPEGHVRWTLDLLAEKSRLILDVPVSRSTIGRILKKRTTATS